jgi:hypothetical protein
LHTVFKECNGKVGEKGRKHLNSLNRIIFEQVAIRSKVFQGRLVLAESVSDSSLIKPENLAVDCFHPSLAGQKHIADKTFSDTWLK